MKKRNFLHRFIDLVEHELEATLAILIVLAAVAGYSLAATDTTTGSAGLTAQQVDVLSISGKTYSAAVFDSSLSGTPGALLVRKVILDSSAPQDLITQKGKGLIGANKDLVYQAKVALSSSYTGSLYVWGQYTSGVVLNGKAVTNSSTAVSVEGATTLIIEFPGVAASISGIGTTAQTSTATETVSNVFVLPNTGTMIVGESRNFVSLVTDSAGRAITASVSWTMTTDPAGIATINPTTGEVTANAAGIVKVMAKANGGKTASATITIIAKPEEPKQVATYPGAPDEDNPEAIKLTPWIFVPVSSSANEQAPAKSLIDQLAELLAPPADAATGTSVTPAKAVTQVLFSDAVAIERQSTAPKQIELKTVTQNMTLVQKLTTTFSVAAKQIVNDVHAMVFGIEIKDAQGKIVIKQSNAANLFVQKVKSLLSGAGAAPTGATPGGESDLPLN